MSKSPTGFNRKGHKTPFCGTTPPICKYNMQLTLKQGKKEKKEKNRRVIYISYPY
jgi:hypothetical protein